MHWWFAQGIPVIAYPMPAYVDAARRANYPLELVNVTTLQSIEEALCQLASYRRRRSRSSLRAYAYHLE